MVFLLSRSSLVVPWTVADFLHVWKGLEWIRMCWGKQNRVPHALWCTIYRERNRLSLRTSRGRCFILILIFVSAVFLAEWGLSGSVVYSLDILAGLVWGLIFREYFLGCIGGGDFHGLLLQVVCVVSAYFLYIAHVLEWWLFRHHFIYTLKQKK